MRVHGVRLYMRSCRSPACFLVVTVLLHCSRLPLLVVQVQAQLGDATDTVAKLQEELAQVSDCHAIHTLAMCMYVAMHC